MKHEHNLTLKIPESIKIKIAQVKQHVQANQTTYLVGAGCLAAGYLLRRPKMVPTSVINNMVAPNIAPVMKNVVHNTVNNSGHCTKLVKRISDGAMWETVTEAAEAAGCSVSKMSRHLNGHKDHVNEEIYKIVGLGTTG